MLWKCCSQYASKFGKLSSGKGQLSFQSQKRAIAKKGQCQRMFNSLLCTIALISHASKVMPKIIQARLQQYVNFQTFKLDLEKAEEPEIKLPTSAGWSKSKTIPEKRLFLLYWLCQSLWLCWSQQAVENSERDGNSRAPDLPPEKSVCRSRSNS